MPEGFVADIEDLPAIWNAVNQIHAIRNFDALFNADTESTTDVEFVIKYTARMFGSSDVEARTWNPLIQNYAVNFHCVE